MNKLYNSNAQLSSDIQTKIFFALKSFKNPSTILFWCLACKQLTKKVILLSEEKHINLFKKETVYIKYVFAEIPHQII